MNKNLIYFKWNNKMATEKKIEQERKTAELNESQKQFERNFSKNEI